MIEQTTSLVLFSRKFSDSSKIVTFYTRRFGKLSCIAKGAISPKSKFGSTLEPFSYSNIQFYLKKSSQLNVLSNSEFEKNFSGIYNDFDKTAIALSILDIINQTQAEHEHNEHVFDVCIEVLCALNDQKSNYFATYIYFILKICRFLGFAINTSVLMESIEPESRIFFFVEDGSFSTKLIGNSGKVMAIDYEIYDRIADLSDCYLSEVEKFQINSIEFQRKINNLLMDYLSFHLEKKIFINSLNLILG